MYSVLFRCIILSFFSSDFKNNPQIFGKQKSLVGEKAVYESHIEVFGSDILDVPRRTSVVLPSTSKTVDIKIVLLYFFGITIIIIIIIIIVIYMDEFRIPVKKARDLLDLHVIFSFFFLLVLRYLISYNFSLRGT